jgi:hypothetical protein
VNYDEFYKEKEIPAVESEGEVEVAGFDGKGVPGLKRRQRS